MAKRTINVEIGGARYRIASDADADHLERLAAIVNERIDALGTSAARTASPGHLLAVVALSLAEDLEGAESRGQAFEQETRATVVQAIERIDRRLESDAQLARQVDRQ